VDAAAANDTEHWCRMQVAHFLYFLKVLQEQLNVLRWRRWAKPSNDTGFTEGYDASVGDSSAMAILGDSVNPDVS
ncbi:MAG: hypothetical protein QGH12_11425, partial [SAR324 cluster bacterium]|nr:hypothetical protein [SAR324 cluster bacterium]